MKVLPILTSLVVLFAAQMTMAADGLIAYTTVYPDCCSTPVEPARDMRPSSDVHAQAGVSASNEQGIRRGLARS